MYFIFLVTKKNRSKPRNMVFTSKYLETPTSDFHNYHSDDIVRASINYIKKNLKPTKKNCITFLYERIPPIEWIPKYDVKQYLVKDLVGGLTVKTLVIKYYNNSTNYTAPNTFQQLFDNM